MTYMQLSADIIRATYSPINNPICLSLWIRITVYSTLSDNVKASRLRGEET